MEPLTSWACDTCGGLLGAKDGIVVWRLDANKRRIDPLIVHKTNREAGVAGCDPGNRAGYVSSTSLEQLLGHDGLTFLLAELSAGPLIGPLDSNPQVGNLDQFVDLVRRVQTPHYEEARLRFGDDDVQARFADANEYLPYTQASLLAIVPQP